MPAKIESLKIDNQETYAGDGEVKLSQTSEDTVEVSGKVSADADKVAVKINDKHIALSQIVSMNLQSKSQ